MNVAVRMPAGHHAMPVAVARLMSLLDRNGVTDVVHRAAGALGLSVSETAGARPVRLHLRSGGEFVLDIVCAGSGKQLFLEVADGDVRDLRAKIEHRHAKQAARLGRSAPLHMHPDFTCIVRLKGEDELIDGLPAHTMWADTKILAHRLNRRAVLRVTAEHGAPAITKVYKKGSHKAGQAVRLHTLLARTAFGETSPVRVPKVYGLAGHWPGYVMELVPGEPVSDLSGGARRRGMHLAGEAMGRLHRLPLRLETDHTPADELIVLRRWVDLTAALFPRRSLLLQQALAHVEKLLAGTQDKATTCMVHRDFHEGQVLVAGDMATLIDFETLGNGEPALDIGNFLAHLDYAGLRDGADAQEEAGLFLAAYVKAHAPAPECRIRAYRAAALLRLSCIHAVPAATRTAAEALTERALSL